MIVVLFKVPGGLPGGGWAPSATPAAVLGLRHHHQLQKEPGKGAQTLQSAEYPHSTHFADLLIS